MWQKYVLRIATTITIISSLMLISLPTCRMYMYARMNEFNAVSTSIELARIQHPAKLDSEMRGIQVVIASWNGWLAYWQTWNRVSILEFYIPNAIDKLEPMK